MVVKPDARLSDTNWLTNAHDSERGMRVVLIEDGERRESEIIDVRTGVNGETVLVTGIGAYTADRINMTPCAVVE